MKNEKYKLVKYDNNGVIIDVRVDEENNTIWLTQNEIASIFKTSKRNIGIHISNFINLHSGRKSDFLLETKEMHINNQKTKLYNLDMIEAISLRSKSTSGYEFIKWVHSILNNNDEVSFLKYSPYEAIEQTYLKYYDGEISMDVKLSLNKVWLTQEQIAKLFDKDVSVISRHIKNILATGECDKSNLQKMQIPFSDKLVNIYDMDVIISVGYRVSSLRGLEFRKWSRNILKDYISEGYSINDKRCLECKTNLISLNNKVLEMEESNKKKFLGIENEIGDLKTNLIDPSKYKEFLILDGEKLEADIAYQAIYKKAINSIIIIDDYIDIKTLQLLKVAKDLINITIISDNVAKNSLNINFINDFINETKFNLSLKVSNNRCHDRYIIIDYKTNNEKIYLSGSSSKDSGNKITSIIKIDSIEIYHPLIDELLNNKELIIK